MSFHTHSPPRVPTTIDNASPQRTVEGPRPLTIEKKFQKLKSYRRTKGLCFKCGEKWNPTHKCSTTVPLNVVEELWQLILEEEADMIADQDKQSSDSGEDLMELSLSAV